ncbi:LacI family DNA-binding transcriptional regulator [Gallibacterium trehalosifermentans]|uniref:LacI family DNA-binding transcriptional regulator n=1 Tax=Gallibacterium trehalosifermentans TaxID=516935 RepID=A0ABV6GZW9_9PAST
MNTNSKRLTITDIAQLTGVSKTTVSMVLNGRGNNFRIKPETQEKILAIAKKHHYKANSVARALQAQRSNTIGLVIPDFSNLGFAATTKTLERLCRDNGLQLIIACSDEMLQQETIAIERLLDRQIDLLITTPIHADAAYYRGLNINVPVIQLDRATQKSSTPFIITDDESAVIELIDTLCQRYQLSEFYYIGGQAELRPSTARLSGFKQGLRKANLTLQPDWVIQTSYYAESAYLAIEQLYHRLGRLPHALFTGSYALLEGVLRFLNDHQLLDQLTSGKMHLSTFDDYELLNCLPFKINSIQQNHQKIAQQLFVMLQALLKGETVENQIIPAKIIWRN